MVFVSAYECACIRACMYIYIYMCVCVCLYRCVFISMYKYVFICVCEYVREGTRLIYAEKMKPTTNIYRYSFDLFVVLFIYIPVRFDFKIF